MFIEHVISQQFPNLFTDIFPIDTNVTLVTLHVKTQLVGHSVHESFNSHCILMIDLLFYLLSTCPTQHKNAYRLKAFVPNSCRKYKPSLRSWSTMPAQHFCTWHSRMLHLRFYTHLGFSFHLSPIYIFKL